MYSFPRWKRRKNLQQNLLIQKEHIIYASKVALMNRTKAGAEKGRNKKPKKKEEREKKDRIFPQSALLILPKTIKPETKTSLRLGTSEQHILEILVCKRTACVRAENASHARDVRFVALMLLVLHCCFAFLMLSVLGPNLPHCDFFALSLASSSCSCSCGRTFFSGMNSLTVAH